MRVIRYFMVAAVFLCCSASAKPALDSAFDTFSHLYEQRWGEVRPCMNPKSWRFSVCASVLRNDGNAPYILHHGKKTANVAILLHGLSDSPYYMQGIARTLYDEGFNVIVPLNVGHGQQNADAIMEDNELAEKWAAHLDDVMAMAPLLGDKIFLGGFSTGGALSIQRYLKHPDDISGLMLFSGALALSDNVESLSRIWGIKWLAKILDGDYEASGPNPYKYPTVASFAGLELMDIIDNIRDQLDEGKTIDVPVFAAHSQADSTTPIAGVEGILDHSSASNTLFVVDESYHLCHADLVLNTKMVADMHFDKTQVDYRDACAVPKANPLYSQMIMMLQSFIDTHAADNKKAKVQ